MNNVILTDSVKEELNDLKEGLEVSTKEKWIIYSQVSNWGRTSIWKKFKRLWIYFYAPFKIFLNRKKFKRLVGWQQFYTLIYCFYCRLFHVKKVNEVYVINFVYKKKKGILGKIYHKFLKYIVTSKYIDLLYVSSYKYMEQLSNDFGVSINKFRLLPFGVEDIYEKYKNNKLDEEFVLSIGRSNRDYDWLVKQWEEIDYPLYIISDTYKPAVKVPNNVTIMNNISGEKQYPYIVSCKALIIPVDIENVCSGDTVLLTAMSFERNVIVTKNSTLAEMYIEDRKDGFIVDKKSKELKTIIKNITTGKIDLGPKARKKFLDNYSRYIMGVRIGEYIKEVK